MRGGGRGRRGRRSSERVFFFLLLRFAFSRRNALGPPSNLLLLHTGRDNVSNAAENNRRKRATDAGTATRELGTKKRRSPSLARRHLNQQTALEEKTISLSFSLVPGTPRRISSRGPCRPPRGGAWGRRRGRRSFSLVVVRGGRSRNWKEEL